MGDGSAAVPDGQRLAGLLQEILSAVPAGCTWLLPIFDAGRVVDFQIVAASDQRRDIYGRGATRRDARLSELYPSMVGGPLWQLYLSVVATGVTGRLHDFRYKEQQAGVVAESQFDVTVTAVLGGLLVWWQRVDEDQQRTQRSELLGRLGWAEYDLASGVSLWSPGMYRIFERDEALGPMSQAEQAAAIVPDDVGISETAWQTLDSGAASDVTVRFRLGGTVKHLRILSDAARDAGGAPLKIHAVVQDVSAREDSRNEIERLRDQLRSREMTALAEHRLAAQLQNMIQPLPRGSVRLPGMEAMVRYLPAESAIQVGGDWYHMQALPDERVVVAVGDVAGHGLEAASAMAHLRYALLAWLSIGLDDPGVLLGHLNRLCGQLATTCTTVLAVYEPTARRIQWARAGHPAPLRARSGRAEPLAAPTGLLLGADDGATYPTAITDLTNDDLVLLYTDGLVERHAGPAGRLASVTRTLAAESTAVDDQSLTRLVGQLGTPSPHDDTCILAIRIRA